MSRRVDRRRAASRLGGDSKVSGRSSRPASSSWRLMICFFSGDEERDCLDEALESETEAAVGDLVRPSR